LHQPPQNITHSAQDYVIGLLFYSWVTSE